MESLNDEERNAIIEYASGGDDLNGAIRHGTMSKDQIRRAAVLDAVIRRSTLPSPMRLFSASCASYLPPFFLVEEIVTRSFTSASETEGATRRYYPGEMSPEVPVKLNISMPVAAGALFIDEIPEASQSEREYLLSRNARFRVDGHREVCENKEIQKIVGGPYRKPKPLLYVLDLTFIGYDD